MTDDLDRLRAALRSAPPVPRDDARDAAFARAMENFDAAAQGSASDTRQTDKRHGFGAPLIDGVRSMFDKLTSRACLAATTGLVTAAVALFVILPDVPQPPKPLPALTQIAPPTDDTAVAVVEPEIVIVEEMAEPLVEPMLLAEPAPMMMARKMAPAAGMMPLADADMVVVQPDTESFANAPENLVKIVAEDPVSTFSIDVDTASYSVVRSSLMNGFLPTADQVRVEEMVNYFPYAYPAPDGDVPFQPTVTVAQTPWNAGTQLVHIALQGELPVVAERPPLNLVFLIDTSGSMQDADKLPLLKQSFRLMLSELRPEDEVAIVAYAGSAGQVLAPTPASDRATILAALDKLDAGGSTAGQEGLQQAYMVAEQMAADGEIGRVLLATDGDFNVGIYDPDALKTFIASKRDSGTYLSVLGFGRGNLDDATMQALAQNGNGQAAYIDTLNEARKVLVDQLTGALFPIANDVKIQVEFNPATVAEYRLIGYETRALNREDFNNDRVDAGEIGAGHSVTAIYEITPVGSDAVLNDPLRYQAAGATSGSSDEIGFLRLRYKEPGEDESRLIETPIPAGITDAGPEQQFAFAIAGFGQMLRQSVYTGDWTFADAIALANDAKGDDAFGYRAGAINLMRLAESLSQ